MEPSSDRVFQAKLLGLLTNTVPAGQNNDKTCAILPIGRTITKLYEAILEDSHLRQSCILFPHFSNPEHTHKSLNELGHHHRFAALGCDGVYIEKQFANLDETTIKKVRGAIPDWGNRRRAIIPTGDNRDANWGRLGAHYCWIKAGEPTIEGLRQALLADEARITFEKPKEPVDRLVSMTVRSSLLGVDPVSMCFNPGFNAIIGGRGSGKSAFLEYLRFGLGRTATDMPGGESRPRERSASLIEETLKDGGYVEIVLEREGITETWRREYATRESIASRDEYGVATVLPLIDAQRKFPARAFDQKGLSSTMTDPERAADQITGIAAAEEVELRRQIDEDIKTSKRSVNTALQQLAAYWQLRLDVQRKAAFAAETQTRAALLRERLRSEGVSSEARDIINQSPRYSRGSAYIRDLELSLTNAGALLADLSRHMLTFEGDAPIETDTPVIAQLKARTIEARVAAQRHLKASVAVLASLDAQKNAARKEFGLAEQEFKGKLEEARLEQESHRGLIDENTRVCDLLQKAQHEEQLATRAADDAVVAEQFLLSASQKLTDNVNQRKSVLKQAAAKVANQSSQTLKARVKADPAPKEYIDAIVALLEGSRVAESRDRTAAWITSALADDPCAWVPISDKILEFYKIKCITGSPAEPGDELLTKIRNLVLAGGVLTPFAAMRFYSQLNDSTVGAVLSAVPRDYIVLKYVDADGRDLVFEKASEGQQASALLELLLRQSAGTLIIDQPEDDLDNNVVMRIVELIRTSKCNRQLVFATHNPNLVVNGDADKIITLGGVRVDPRPGSDGPRVLIQSDGAIETPVVKKAITDIMEGGEQAFDLRRRKYRFGAEAA